MFHAYTNTLIISSRHKLQTITNSLKTITNSLKTISNNCKQFRNLYFIKFIEFHSIENNRI